MIAMTRVYKTYVIKPIADNSSIFGLFFLIKEEEETKLELMEIIGEHDKLIQYIRDVFF